MLFSLHACRGRADNGTRPAILEYQLNTRQADSDAADVALPARAHRLGQCARVGKLR
jgi:hypothetical protein